MTGETIIENVKDVVAVASTIVESAKEDIVWQISPAMLAIFVQYGAPKNSKMLLEKGGRIRGITQISETSRDVVRKFLDAGEEVRHTDQFKGAFMIVADKKESISSVNPSIKDLSLDDRVVAFWTDDQAYADFLTATFEAAWSEAVEAETRLGEL
jgi:hypothetical protein